MRRLTPLFLAITIFSCSEIAQDSDKVRISGIIENPAGENVRVLIPEDTTYSVDLDSSNSFYFEFAIDTTARAYFYHGNERAMIYLTPGDSMQIFIDSNEFDESITFKGTGSATNNYLAEATLLQEQLPVPYRLVKLNLPEEEKSYENINGPAFIQAVDSMYQAHISLIERYESQLDPVFANLEKGKRLYNAAAFKQNLGRQLQYIGVDAPDNFYDYENSLDFSSEEFAEMRDYHFYLSEYVSNRLYEGEMLTMEDYFKAIPSYFRLTDSAFQHPTIKSRVLGIFFDRYSRELGYEKLVELQENYKNVLESSEEEKLQEKIDQLAKIRKGAEVPNFTFYTLEEDSVQLSDYRGKIVYIDFWATWCGPCIGEQPYLEQVIESLGEDKIEFISLSTDATKDPWKKMVAEKQLSGTHLWTKGAWDADIMDYFVISGIPHYVIIDENGKIYDNNATRPSQGVEEELKELAGKLPAAS